MAPQGEFCPWQEPTALATVAATEWTPRTTGDPSRPAAHLLAATTLSALALTGCSVIGGGGDGGSDDSSSAAESSAADSNSDSDSPSAVASSAETAGIDPDNLPEPIGTATIPAVSPADSDPKATLKVELLGLERKGELVVATFAFTPKSTDDGHAHLYDWLGGTGWKPYLVDTTNLKRHDVVEDKETLGITAYRSDYSGSEFASGQTWYAYAGFAAPPKDVTSVDIAAVDGAPAFTGVPIK